MSDNNTWLDKAKSDGQAALSGGCHNWPDSVVMGHDCLVIQEDTPIRVALLGCGTVGSHVAKLLLEPGDLQARVGHPLELIGIGVKHPDRLRPGIDQRLLTADVESLADRADVVIEAIGGIEPARGLLLRAMAHGASVVTANKVLLGACGPDLYAAAEAARVDLYFEAAVAGAIPIIRPLRESLVGDEILAVKGIVNGTTNFILDQMTTTGQSFEAALARAQELGFAEPDPTADVEGFDAAAKASLLASLAFRTEILADQVSRQGITDVRPADIVSARRMGCVIKLLAIAAPIDSDPAKISVRVHPSMVPTSHPLANVHGPYNAIFIESRHAGRLMFLGPGAGGAPTASAIMGDLVAAARNRVRGTSVPPVTVGSGRTAAGIDEAVAAACVSMEVVDSPGVLARVAAVFADHGVSISAVRQVQSDQNPTAALLEVTTHPATSGAVTLAVDQLRGMTDTVCGEIRFYRVEEV